MYRLGLLSPHMPFSYVCIASFNAVKNFTVDSKDAEISCEELSGLWLVTDSAVAIAIKTRVQVTHHLVLIRIGFLPTTNLALPGAHAASSSRLAAVHTRPRTCVGLQPLTLGTETQACYTRSPWASELGLGHFNSNIHGHRTTMYQKKHSRE